MPAMGGRSGETATADREDEDKLPLWWLFLLPLYWFPQSINFSIIQTYLMPFQIEAI
eukprot:COSAG05_NODE_9891_length_595_cov_1.040323_1_plen_56_part_01